MASAAVSFDLREIEGLAKILNEAKLSPRERTQLLHDIGEEVVVQIQNRLTVDKEDPEGNPWQAIAEKTDRYYKKYFPEAKPPLWRKGELLDTLESQINDSWSILVGATKEYAATHQFGRPEANIPARPYLGISKDDAEEIAAIAQNFLAGRLK
jgi:phage virion morphogenesis protein